MLFRKATDFLTDTLVLLFATALFIALWVVITAGDLWVFIKSGGTRDQGFRDF